MSTWSKLNHRTISQENAALPPTWCPRPPSAPFSPEHYDSVLASGAQLVSRLVGAIDKASEIIVLATFLFADANIEAALLRAAHRGVRIYLLLAAETRLEREAIADSHFDQNALAAHKKMLNTLAGWALIRSSSQFHAKALLIDPHHDGPAYLLTANFTHDALTRNEELAIELTRAEARAAFAHLSWAMWEAAEHETHEPNRLPPAAEPLKVVPKPASRGPIYATLAGSGTLRARLLTLINAAKREIIVASFGWEADHDVVRALCHHAQEGVAITVLARPRAASMPALVGLAAAGARVLGFEWLHAKAVSVDGERCLVMSANLERQGLDAGVELGVELDGHRAAAALNILRSWAQAAPLDLRPAPRLGELEGSALVWVDKRLVVIDVAAQQDIELSPVVAPSADHLEAEPVIPRRNNALPTPARVLRYTWEVVAPRLGAKAKPYAVKGAALAGQTPAVYRESGGGRLVVAIRSVEEMGRARELAQKCGAQAIVVL